LTVKKRAWFILNPTVDKDNVDQTAEWRYYGADDNQNSDPTRCGMPEGRFSFHNE
jgi:hypothetical protein